MRTTLLVMAALLATGTPALTQTCPSGVPLAIVGADVLTMVDSVLLRDQTVLVEEGRISEIGAPSLPPGACLIDGRDRVVLPGLVDLHVHTEEREMPLFLANGVTSIREMNGTPRHLDLRGRIERGEAIGPRMLVASPLLTGSRLEYRHRLIVSADDAYAAAREAKSAGYDYLKVYDDLPLSAYYALVEAGRELGMPLDGHIPAAVGLAAVIEAGQTIEHIDKVAFDLAGHPGNPAKLPVARELFQGREVWLAPTLASLRALDLAGTAVYAERLGGDEMKYMSEESLAWWRSLAGSGAREPTRSPYYQFQLDLLQVLREAGARLFLGTDSGNPLMVGGFAVHEELRTLVEDAGFTPFEALRTATRNAGLFLGSERDGTVQPDARADLLLVEANPLIDLETLRRPVGVIVAGRWLDRAQLEAALPAAVP